jgi:glucuronoarabinoxylan endo-1,4-beta-xylanase
VQGKMFNGSVAVVVLNTATTAQTATFAGTGGFRATPYLTDATHDTAAQGAIPVVHGSFTAALPPRSLVTYDIPASR